MSTNPASIGIPDLESRLMLMGLPSHSHICVHTTDAGNREDGLAPLQAQTSSGGAAAADGAETEIGVERHRGSDKIIKNTDAE